MNETLIKVGGMSCQKCVASVTAALQGVPGVSAVAVSLDAGEAKVGYDPAQATEGDLRNAVEDAGFDAT